MRSTLLLIVAVCGLLQAHTHAWGEAGHRVVSRAALLALPPDVPAFLARQIEWIGSRSVLADSWRRPTEPFAKATEDPNHVWYMEQFAFMREIPRSRDAFMLAVYDEHLRRRSTDPDKAAFTNIHYTGTLPYAATEGFERLKVAFRTWRELRAQKQDTTFIEQDAAFYLGWVSHYIADGAQPLHTSIHHDGWVGENARNYTRDGAIHWEFENTFVDRIGLHERDILGRIPRTAQRLSDPFTTMLAMLDRAHTRVEEVYQLAQRKAYVDRSNREGRELVYICTSEAAATLRDVIYTAWLSSAEPVPSYSAADPTNSPTNPLYNPATGSAPSPAPTTR